MASYLSYNTQTNWKRSPFAFSQSVEYTEEEEDDDVDNYFRQQQQENQPANPFTFTPADNSKTFKTPNSGEYGCRLFACHPTFRSPPFTYIFPLELLCSASWSNDYGALQEILRHQRLDVNTPDARSFTALHYSSSNGDSEITAALLENGSNANGQDKNGYTPLMHACAQANFEVVQSLVDHGADINIQNVDGESALHVACSVGNENIAEFLLEHGAHINQCNLDGVTGKQTFKTRPKNEIVHCRFRIAFVLFTHVLPFFFVCLLYFFSSSHGYRLG